jgi:hypothetical protein
MGFEDEVEQPIGRPCGQTNGRSKRPNELTSSIVPRGTSFHRSVELEFPSMRLLGMEAGSGERDLYTFECEKCEQLEVRGGVI